MKSIIQKVLVPLCGVMLGTAALGNLLQSYSEGVRYFCGVLAGIMLVLVLLKLIMFPKAVAEEFKNPVSASVAATFPMALMLLSAYVKPFIGGAAYAIWLLAVALHAILIVWFTLTFVVKFDLKNVHASWFIVYVGIVVASVSAPAYDRTGDVGTIAFWFGFICLLILLVVVSIRYKKLPVPPPARPLFCIYAAPTSLCIAGYVQSVTPKSAGFILALYVLACILYVVAFVRLISCLKGPFFPSYAAFTFPFTISSIASMQAANCLSNLGSPLPLLKVIGQVETVITVLLTAYVIIRFAQFLFSTPKPAASK